MATWQDLIGIIFRDCGVLGVGQTLQAQDTIDAVRRINMMLSQWQRRRWLVFNLVDHALTMDGSLFYTIGAGGQINTPRPDKIESAFVRQLIQSQPNQVDYPLRLITSYEEYSRISLKNLAAGPGWYLFYDSGWPLGKLYPWPLMNSQYALHVQIKNTLGQITNIDADTLLPPEYEMAIYAVQMKMTRIAYRLPPDQMINRMAKEALDTLRSSNFQVPTLNMPGAVRARGAGYSIWSDSFGPMGG